jgi:hypothetical protein
MIKPLLTAAIFLATPVFADAPVINYVNAQNSGGFWSFSVTISHGDTGWDDYADGWRVVDANGNVLGVRNLAHPHVNEQPFTRSLSGVSIPAGLDEVGIQASDSVGGWSSDIKRVKLK